MDNKQLKIEMLTDTNEAREVIESTMEELRRALADNQIDLDSISVDSLDKLDQLLAGDAETSAEDQAREFLSEFKHQNNKWRQSMIDFPSVGQRKSQLVEDNLILQENQRTKSNRRLDLVA